LVAILSVVMVERGRHMMIDSVFHAASLSPERIATQMAAGITVQMNGVLLLAASVGDLLLLAIFTVGIPWMIWRWRGRKPFAAWLLTGFAAITLVETALAGAHEWNRAVVHALAGLVEISPEEKPATMLRTFMEASQRLEYARHTLLGAGAIALAAGVLRAVRAARKGLLASNAILLVSGVLFIAGVATVAATRNHAQDGAHPLDFGASCGEIVDLQRFHPPRVAACGRLSSAPVQGPIIEVGGNLSLNGAVEHDLAALRGDLMTLRNNYKVLHPGEPVDSIHLLLVADSRAPAARLDELAREVTEPLGYQIRLLAAHPQPFETGTLGHLEHTELCMYPLAFAADGRHFETLGELAIALSSAQEALKISR
jgi:hypothetical protein